VCKKDVEVEYHNFVLRRIEMDWNNLNGIGKSLYLITLLSIAGLAGFVGVLWYKVIKFILETI
jgi:hypothetical protein